VNNNGWMIWPPIRYSYQTVNNELPSPAPSPPAFLLSKEDACKRYEKGVEDVNCVFGNMNWLGTDDQGRDVIARLIYGFRISVLFGLVLTVGCRPLSAWRPVRAGLFRRLDGPAVPALHRNMDLDPDALPADHPGGLPDTELLVLLGIMLLFSWTALVGVVRAEFLRARNFEYVRAARALGVTDGKIMFRTCLPNAMVATLTFLPFILSGSVTTLTALDFLGFGLPPGSPIAGRDCWRRARPTCKRPGWG
jgi:microcin C transport system permease protein